MRAGDTITGAVVLEPMIPGHHEPLTIELGQPLAHIEGVRTKAELVCSWSDNSGDRDEVLVSDLPSGTTPVANVLLTNSLARASMRGGREPAETPEIPVTIEHGGTTRYWVSRASENQ
jgi:hypothetical protein